MKIGNREFDVKNRTYIMGILNVTPDSFSDGGKWNTMDHALMHAEAMIKDGADILDVGGESTRPGHTPVSAEEEAARVVPVIEALRKRFDVPISVDTYKGSVADAAVQAGAMSTRIKNRSMIYGRSFPVIPTSMICAMTTGTSRSNTTSRNLKKGARMLSFL